MATGRTRAKRPRKRVPAAQMGVFQELGVAAFGHALQSHIADLSYDLLKDPEYQRWMEEWLDRFARIWLRKRAQAGNGKKARRT